MHALRGLLGCALLLPALAGAAAQTASHDAQPFTAAATEVRARTLANGMQVLVWPDHNIPNIALYNWVHVGSRNEGTGTTGLAHFFEHMMFNGTEKRAQGEFDEVMASAGGSNNAFTSSDVTVYQDWIPRDALETVFELESDRLGHLAFKPQVVESERKVVYSERRLRIEDSNPALLGEQLQATAFVAHPYRIPTIGWPSDIQSWTLADLQNFFHTWYVPNNCTLVIVGDVDPEAVFRLADRYFGPLKSGGAPLPTVRTKEPEQLGERRLQLHRPGQNPLLQIAWHGINATDARAPALNILQSILVGGDAARLQRRLVEEQKLAVEIGGGWPEGFDPGLFSLEATLPEGGSTDRLEQALDAEIAALLKDGVTEQELRRAKNQWAVGFWNGVSSIDGKARMLGEYAAIHGDYQALFAAPAAYEAVTREQVLAVARDVFKADQRTVGVLVPTGEQP